MDLKFQNERENNPSLRRRKLEAFPRQLAGGVNDLLQVIALRLG